MKTLDYWPSEDITVVFTLSSNKTSEISFGSLQRQAAIFGVKLFERSGPEIYKELCLLDRLTMQDVGMTVFFELGLVLDGFLTVDQDARVVTVFEQGVWSKDDPRLKPVSRT